jgi:ParB-like chromosome segregation protein Spo0J
MEAEKVRVVLTPLSEITEADRNVKDHDIGAIHESMNRFGFTSPLLMNEATKKLVAGHGRVEALRQKKQFGEEAPNNIEVGEKAQAYLLADNRLTELGGWNTTALVEELQKLAESSSLEGTGFDDADLNALMEEYDSSSDDGSDSSLLPVGAPKYEIVFDDESQQAMWFTFLNWLKDNTDGETIGERLYQHIELILGE